MHSLRGNTVTTIDLTTNTATSWCSYDEFGNQESSNPANRASINYSTYAQAERATNTTGLILMGARVYNPETNQFTSPDPIPGGNENSYTYPSNPMIQQDFYGQWWGFVTSIMLGVVANVATAAACGLTMGAGCLAASMLIHTAAGALGGLAEGVDAGHTGSALLADVGYGAVSGFAEGALGFMGGFASELKHGVQIIVKKNILRKVVVTTRAMMAANKAQSIVKVPFIAANLYAHRDECIARAKKSYVWLQKLINH